MSRGVNANLLRRWVVEAERELQLPVLLSDQCAPPLDAPSTEGSGFAFGEHMLDAPIGYDPEQRSQDIDCLCNPRKPGR
ncbi:MAG: hypothetical protein JWN85_2883 [Gammaproteobacteria bacterium]|nr:hypothetical protein [Gammaproteobacteria bacterium]